MWVVCVSVDFMIVMASTCQSKVDYNVFMGGGMEWMTLHTLGN
jgi:hypothetical protein